MTDKDRDGDDALLTAGGKGLAFHGPMLYEVKILKTYDPATGKSTIRHPPSKGGNLEDIKEPEPPIDAQEEMYFVHYRGWKTTWDEWIGTDRLLPYTDENAKLEKELKDTYLHKKAPKKTVAPTGGSKRTTGKAGAAGASAARKEDSPAAGAGSNGTPGSSGSAMVSTSNGTTRGNKRSRAHIDSLGSEDEYLKTPEIQLAVPSALKSLLVDDWELVTKEHKVLPLPRKPSVADILLEYSKVAVPSSDPVSAERETFKEIISGIKLYFDRSLGNILLYRYERPQYFDLRAEHPNFVPSDYYGAEHLLRLFVALPGLIAQTSMDTQAVSTLRKHLEEFLRYLAANQKHLFTTDYIETRRFPDSLDP